ncbi:MAG: hypothetical protein KKB50_14100 [Planctomycetes bacterium]|nr:hypothetical protein [Planctomycetota bacterium]
MRMLIRGTIGGLLALLIVGCLPAGGERNPFLTLTDVFGVSSSQDTDSGGAAGGAATEDEFRRTITVTFANQHPDAELHVSFAAWVYASSIRSAEQQDALLSGGYVQLAREVEIGTAFTLTPGTFVYNGPGTAGATRIRLPQAGDTGGDPLAGPATAFALITPDVVLAYLQPPVSCDTVAFEYEIQGRVQTGPATGTSGGRKTLAQIDAYQCEPLRPGMFLKLGGGVRESNEFFEGEDIRFDFFDLPDADGNFATVTILS